MTTNKKKENIILIVFILIIIIQLLCTVLNFCVFDLFYLVILLIYFLRYIYVKKSCL